MAPEILLTLTEAIDRAGPRLYGEAWIQQLSKSDRKILSEFGPQPRGQPQQTIGRCPNKWRNRLDRVMGSDLRLGIQRATVLDWIFGANVMTSRLHCDQAALDRALAKSQRVSSGVGAPPVVRQRVIRAMLDDIRRGRVTTTQLAGMKQEALAEMYGAARKPCVDARKNALAEAARLPRID